MIIPFLHEIIPFTWTEFTHFSKVHPFHKSKDALMSSKYED